MRNVGTMEGGDAKWSSALKVMMIELCEMSLGLIDGAAILLELCGNSMAGHKGEGRVMGTFS